MHASDSARIQQRLKIEAIGTTLAECGFVALDEQAYVLGLSRSTAWTVIRAMHKNSGLSAMTINRMLDTVRLPPRIRLKLLEYIAEKMSGAYGDRKHNLEAFAGRISPVHMQAALCHGAKPNAAHEAADVPRRYSPFFAITAASRPSKFEPGSDHGSSQS